MAGATTMTEKEAFIKSAGSNNCDCIEDEIIGAAWDGDTDEDYYTQLTDALNIWQDAKKYYEGLAVFVWIDGERHAVTHKDQWDNYHIDLHIGDTK